MRIERIQVDAFGILRDLVIEPHAGLTLIRGANEAGKTTILAFIRAMLFGFQRERHIPPDGSRRGGAVDLSTTDGRTVRVERRASGDRGGAGQLRVLDHDGRDAGAGLLAGLLRQVDEPAYRNIFAFGLEQLAQFRTLSEGDVAARIYGAGLGTGAVSALGVESALEKERAAIYLPSGQRPSLNQVLAAIETLDQGIRRRDLPSEHREAAGQARALDAAIAGLESEIARAQAEVHRLERLQRAWKPWQELRGVIAERDGAPDPPSFPANVREVLAALDAASVQAAGILGRTRDARERAERELNACRVDQAILTCRDEIEGASLAVTEERAHQGELRMLLEERAGERAGLDGDLARLGHGWDDARVRSYDVSLAVRRTITESFGQRLAASEREVRDRTADVRNSERERAAALAELAAVEEPAGEAGMAGTPADAAADAARIAERARLVARLEGATQARALLAAIPEDPGGPSPGATTGGRMAGRRWMLAAGACAAVGVVLAAVAGLSGLTTVAAVALLAGGVAGVTIFLIGDRVVGWVTGEREAADGAARRVAHLDEAIRSAATALGLPPTPSDEQVSEARLAVDSEREALAQRRSLLERQQAAADRLSRAEERLALDQEAVVAAAEARDGLGREWAAWLVSHGLPGDLDPGTAAEVVGVVADARRHAEALDRLDGRIERAAARRAAVEASATVLLGRLGRAVPPPDQVAGAVGILRRELEAALEADRTRLAAAQERARCLAEEVAAERRATDARAALEACIEQHGAASLAELRDQIDAADRRRDLDRSEADLRLRLEALAGPGPAMERLMADLEQVDDIATVELECINLRERSLPELSASRDAAREDRRSLRDRIHLMETSADVSSDRQKLAESVGIAQAEAERWCTLTIASSILRRTRERYERAHQPAVVRIAEELFRDWTGGRYRRIVAPLDGASAGVSSIEHVERSDGRLLPITSLSTGTAEQLYLALRLGMVEHFASTAESLPLVMDDVLVNFDPARAGRAARSVEALSALHQVLYFTCHPETPLRADLEIELGSGVAAGDTGA